MTNTIENFPPGPLKEKPTEEKYPDRWDIYLNNEKFYKEQLKLEFSFNQEDMFEKGVEDLLKVAKNKFIIIDLLDSMRGIKPLGDEINNSIFFGLDCIGRMAILLHRDGKDKEAESIKYIIQRSYEEAEEVMEERHKIKPKIDSLIKMDIIEKMFHVQSALGCFEEIAKTNEPLRNLLDEVENDFGKIINSGDEDSERSLWDLMLGLEKTSPEKLGKILKEIVQLLD